MKFYVPEWDDAVDADYDFIHDETSHVNKGDRNRQYIWDIYDRDQVPIDGVLISREQVEESNSKYERLIEYGVHDDPELSIPRSFPTISDCGAWGYQSLPFPPYSNDEMLEFYEALDVDVGVTIDHLVLGSGNSQGRLYLNERALGPTFTEDDLPTAITERVDLTIEKWPEEWPNLVKEYEPSITSQQNVIPFQKNDFRGNLNDVLSRLEDDPRAVYRENDAEFRYRLTLNNAREMFDLYHDQDCPFRLMAAFQGWNPRSYAQAASEVLDIGFQYIGIGGVAGSPVEKVQEIVSEVGVVIADHQSVEQTRIDAHVFGFAKTDAFDTIGRSGMASFDSASMLRSAWTGGNNYHLEENRQYDAIRVRYSSSTDDLDHSIRKALRAQEVLHALRAYDQGKSISTAIEQWFETASTAIENLPEYLDQHRLDHRYNEAYLRDIKRIFRDHYDHAYPLSASFGGDFIREIIGLLRDDDPEDPLDYARYEKIISTGRNVIRDHPKTVDQVEQLEGDASIGSFDQVWVVVEDYARSDLINDQRHLDGYRQTLKDRPWEDCDCRICEELGIDIAIFRGNNRNRRRGFHNTKMFYEVFEEELPKILVVTSATSNLLSFENVENYLRSEHRSFWTAVNDLPVIETGVFDANAVYEWWESTPNQISLDPTGIQQVIKGKSARYPLILTYDPGDKLAEFEESSGVVRFTSGENIRRMVLNELGYTEDFTPESEIQVSLGEF